MAGIPNLFRTQENFERAQWYYEMFLSRLNLAGRATRMIAVCRQIRRFTASCKARHAGIFTYHWEMEAYGELRDFDSMWRVLRAWEQAVFKKRVDLRKHRWKAEDFPQLIYSYAPLLYLRGTVPARVQTDGNRARHDVPTQGLELRGARGTCTSLQHTRPPSTM